MFRPPRKTTARQSQAGAPQPAPPPSLRDAQALFQAAILSGDPRILANLKDNSRTTRDTLLGVYQHGYAARLVEILANDFETVAAVCGDERFDEIARAYIAAHPSHTQNARYYSERFPAFLAAFPALAARPEVADIAVLEQALGFAFDAPDAAVLTLERLAAFPAEQWGRLRFAPHPSARLLRFETDAFDIWRRHGAEQPETGEPMPPEPAVTGQPTSVLVWRAEAQAIARRLHPEEAMLWREAEAGRTFDALCEMLATYDNPETAASRAAGYLQGWLSDGALTDAALADANASKARRTRPTSATRASR